MWLFILANEAPVGYNYWTHFLKMTLIIGGLLLFCFICMKTMRSMGSRRLLYGNTRHHIKILERRPLSPKSTLFLIEIGGRGLIVSDSPGGVQFVAEVPIELNEDEAAKAPFNALLKTTLPAEPTPNEV